MNEEMIINPETKDSIYIKSSLTNEYEGFRVRVQGDSLYITPMGISNGLKIYTRNNNPFLQNDEIQVALTVK